MSKSSEKVKRWRKLAKNISIICMGNACQICGYNRCKNAMELHHIDPSQKETSISGILASCRSWDFLYKELDKCILLCSNCHREYHAGIIELPIIYTKFNKILADRIRIENKNGLVV